MKFTNNGKEYGIEVTGHTGPDATFTVQMIKPGFGAGTFTKSNLKTRQGITGIEFYRTSPIGMAASGGNRDVLFSLSLEAIEYIKDAAADVEQEFRRRAAAKPVERWEFGIGADSFQIYLSPIGLTHDEYRAREDLREIVAFAQESREVRRELVDRMTAETKISENRGGICTRSGWYGIDDADLREIVGRVRSALERQAAAREAAKQEAFDAAHRQAQETGKPALLRRWTEACNDPREECDIDGVSEYVCPDGSTHTRRFHTW